jgi:hypothetical protein
VVLPREARAQGSGRFELAFDATLGSAFRPAVQRPSESTRKTADRSTCLVPGGTPRRMRRAAASRTLTSGFPMSPTSAAPPSPSRIATAGRMRHSRTTRIRRWHSTSPPTRSSCASVAGAGGVRTITVDATGRRCFAVSPAAYSNTRRARSGR